jgi:hypothetical protein
MREGPQKRYMTVRRFETRRQLDSWLLEAVCTTIRGGKQSVECAERKRTEQLQRLVHSDVSIAMADCARGTSECKLKGREKVIHCSTRARLLDTSPRDEECDNREHGHDEWRETLAVAHP